MAFWVTCSVLPFCTQCFTIEQFNSHFEPHATEWHFESHAPCCHFVPSASLLNNLIHILNPMPPNGILNHMLCTAILNPVPHYWMI
jgi:hypothetical protein